MVTFEICKKQISRDLRLDASYYSYSVILQEAAKYKGINFIKLKDLTSVISDGEHSAIPRLKEGGVRYLYGRNIKDGIVNFDPIADSSYISYADYNKFQRVQIEENDILLTIVGTVGNTAVYKQAYIGLAGIPRHIAKIRLKEECMITPEYLVAYFLSKTGKNQINKISTGNIQPLLSIGNISKLDIPILPKADRDKISVNYSQAIECETEALSLINKARELFYKALNVDLNSAIKIKFYEINSKDLFSNDTWTSNYTKPLYVETAKIIKDSCAVIQLGKVATFTRGDEVGSSSYTPYVDKDKSDIPFIRTSDIVNFEIDQYPDYYVSRNTYNALNQGVKVGDLLFTVDGKIGCCGLITETDEAIYSSGLQIIRINELAHKYGITNEYLFIVLSTKETGLYPAHRRTVIASTIPHLRKERLAQIEIPILSETVITEITNLIKQAFVLKTMKKKLIAEVKDIFDEELI